MIDLEATPPDANTQICNATASRDKLESAVQTLLDTAYGQADIEGTLGGVHVSWPNPKYTDREPLVHLFFQGSGPYDVDVPFVTQEAIGTVTIQAVGGDWQRWEDLEAHASPDLHTELQGRYTPTAGDKQAIENQLKGLVSGHGM